MLRAQLFESSGKQFWGPLYPNSDLNFSSSEDMGVITSLGPQNLDSAISIDVPAVLLVFRKMKLCLCEMIIAIDCCSVSFSCGALFHRAV